MADTSELRRRNTTTTGVDGENDGQGEEGSSQQQQQKHVDGDTTKLLATQPASTKWRSFRTRTTSTVLMIGGFVFVMYLGHVWLAILTLIVQTLMVRELFKLAAKKREEADLPGFRLQQWYFYAAMIFYTYGRFLMDNMYTEIAADRRLLLVFGWTLAHHTLVSYLLYIVGFVSFVGSLEKGYYYYQITQFAWTHMIIITVVAQSSFFVANIFKGIIWFILPVLLIVINDISAYLWGFTFGRTPLIKLSPKKTWEGFIGAFFTTVIAGYYLGKFLGSYSWLTCPREDLQVTGWLECEQSEVFTEQNFYVKQSLHEFFNPYLYSTIERLAPETVTCVPIQMHAVVLSIFSSLIAPFGGFFASGFKRAFKIKDFGDSIPGHGGLTDRMDCQVIMAAFSYLYYTSFVSPPVMTVGALLAKISQLNAENQLLLYKDLGNMLAQRGLAT